MNHLVLNGEAIRYLNLGLCLTTCVVSGISALIIFINKNRDRVGTQYLFAMALGNLLLSFGYVVESICASGDGPAYRNLMYAGVFLEFLMPNVLTLLLTLYIFYRVDDAGGWIRHPRAIYAIYTVAFVLLAVMSMNGKYFYLNEANEYCRGDFFLLSQIVGALLVGYSAGILISRGEELEDSHRRLFWAYMLIPFAALLLQIAVPGVAFLVLATTVTLLVMVVIIQLRQTELYFMNEKELTDVRVKLLLAQMRPHFLYNALSSISQLCRKNPRKASEMTDRFAEFLRKNMNDVDRNQLIPIEQEIRHIDNYISIEQMRFGDMIHVEYDLQAKDFSIPSLVLQPIVENAIRHGLRGREDGGTIYISTKKTGSCYMLSVIDDGVGFDIKRMRQDDRVHLGLESVKRRMEIIPLASFMLTSKPDVGTTAVFLIPIEGTTRSEVKKQQEQLKKQVITN